MQRDGKLKKWKNEASSSFSYSWAVSELNLLVKVKKIICVKGEERCGWVGEEKEEEEVFTAHSVNNTLAFTRLFSACPQFSMKSVQSTIILWKVHHNNSLQQFILIS